VPNALHEALAQALSGGVLHAAITPNYDCAFDATLARDGLKLTRVVRPEEWTERADTRGVYFKIQRYDSRHRRLTAYREASRRSSSPEVEAGSAVGYSSLDFELCPALLQTRLSRVVWNAVSARLSPNAARVLDQFDGDPVIGDMRILFHRLFGTPKAVAEMTGRGPVEDAVRDRFLPKARAAWAARLLNQIGYVRGADRFTRVPSAGSFADVMCRERAQSLMGGARYRTAAREWTALAAEAEVRNRPLERAATCCKRRTAGARTDDGRPALAPSHLMGLGAKAGRREPARGRRVQGVGSIVPTRRDAPPGASSPPCRAASPLAPKALGAVRGRFPRQRDLDALGRSCMVAVSLPGHGFVRFFVQPSNVGLVGNRANMSFHTFALEIGLEGPATERLRGDPQLRGDRLDPAARGPVTAGRHQPGTPAGRRWWFSARGPLP
jgi:hypothetical protein